MEYILNLLNITVQAGIHLIIQKCFAVGSKLWLVNLRYLINENEKKNSGSGSHISRKGGKRQADHLKVCRPFARGARRLWM